MNTSIELNLPPFNSTVTNAVKILSHVWRQIYALERHVNLELPTALSKKIFLLASEMKDKDDAHDTHEDVCIGYMWYYELRDNSTRKRGKKKLIARLYFQIYLAPDESQYESVVDFVPFLGIHVISENDAKRGYELADLGIYTEYRAGEGKGSKLLDEKFRAAALGAFEWKNDEGRLWAAAACLPLGLINSQNVDGVVDLAVLLAKHCCEAWKRN